METKDCPRVRDFPIRGDNTLDYRLKPSGQWRLTMWLLAIGTAAAVANVVRSAEIHLVLPDQYADREGEETRGSARNLRTQIVYSADGFSQLLSHDYCLTKVSFRPDGSTGSPQTWSADRLTINASVTQTTPSLISLRFADNVTAAETAVLDGPWQGGTQNLGPSGGPKEFDIDFVLDHPFQYDPSEGNLLLDFRIQGFSGNTMWMDATSQTFENAAWDDTFNSAVAPWRGGGAVAMFTFEHLALGDLNLDGVVDGLDVDPFVEVLLSGPYQQEADMNEDQVVNGLDVDPFVAAVVGGTQPVPEPSTLLLVLVALGVVGGWRKWVG